MFAITALHITAHTNANDFEFPDAADGCAHAVWRGRGDLYVHARAPRPRRMQPYDPDRPGACGSWKLPTIVLMASEAPPANCR